MVAKNKVKYWEGIGRRKTSSARVRLYEGESSSSINGKPVDQVYPNRIDQDRINQAFAVAGCKGKLYFTARVKGGGKNGQKESVVLGISRALIVWDKSLATTLKKEKLLTRDPREKERKKYFFRKARKKPQFSKR